MSVKSKLPTLPRAKGVSDRLVAIGLAGRFVDELLGGLPAVLLPTIRQRLGLSYAQVSLLELSLNYVAAVVEPINGLLIDVWRRPWLMAWGAAGIGLAVAVMGAAPTFLLLLLGYIIYGLASGPLAHTADVVLIEAYPTAPDRIYARSTLVDTIGALLAPLLVSLTIWAALSWRWLMILMGLSGFVYAALILRTTFPPGQNGQAEEKQSSKKQLLRDNIRQVLTDRSARLWLLFLFVHMVWEAPLRFTTIWLFEEVGMGQGLIGLYVMMEMGVGLISLLYLDRWLARSGYRRVLQVATLGLLVLFPTWLLLPGLWTRFLLAIPLNFLFSVYWPIGKAQSLAAVPGKGGSMTAVQSLFGFVPLPFLFGLLAEALTLTTAMLLVILVTIPLMWLTIWLLGR